MTPPTPSESPVYINPSAASWRHHPSNNPLSPAPNQPQSPVQTLHRLLPSYAPTPLHPLPALARSLGLAHVLLKDESHRFGLPSFKILGASWAVYRAVADRLGVDALALLGEDEGKLSLGRLGELVREKGTGIKIVTCTEGNWGRAVARMAGYLGLEVVVFVPGYMAEATRGLIKGEGAEVRVVEGGYDAAVEVAKRVAGEVEGGLLVMDIGWEGYEAVPEWVVAGYQTMLDESDAQVLLAAGGQAATHAIVPVGCGSIAQAVTQHFKSVTREQNGTPAASVLAVEPDTATCLRASLENGKMTSVTTSDSIMCGMNCGTLSTAAWPVLQSGVDAAVVVRDSESHDAIKVLEELGIKAGPCGAAALAALKRICEADAGAVGLSDKSVVVLYCTEGPREYEVPV